MKEYRSVSVVIFVILLSVVISSLLAGSAYAGEAKPVHQLVLYIDVDTGQITFQAILEDEKVKYTKEQMKEFIKRWPPQGVRVGTIKKLKSIDMVIYEDTDDCYIFIDHETGVMFQWNP